MRPQEVGDQLEEETLTEYLSRVVPSGEQVF